ncbi:MAG: DUF192 domain-containing protein [Planctomycetaceae bacterium]
MSPPAEREYQLINPDTAEVLVPQLQLAATFWTRFRGLQFQRELPPDEGLLVAPCRSVHTHWMRFAIDVVMIDAEGTVLKVRRNMKPWRACNGPKHTRAVLEVPAETATVREGDRVTIVAPNGHSVPKCVQSLFQQNRSSSQTAGFS